MIFDSNDGTIKTSIMFEGSGITVDRLLKTIIISSGATPIAYMVTKHKPNYLCSGNKVFSFDPLTFSPNARWVKIINPADSCNYLGISFGWSESIIYAYNEQSSNLKLSRIDDSAATPSI